MDANDIRTQEVKKCLLCEEEGVLFWANLPDRLFGVPGLWSFRKCPDCGLVWLSPRPIAEDIGKTYTNYMTHNAHGSKSRMEDLQEKIALPVLFSVYQYSDKHDGLSRRAFSGRLLSWIPLFNDVARRYVMNLRGDQKGRLLDVGCGDGKFLADMKRLGWEVVGVEPDPEAAKIAEERLGLSVFTGTLGEANFPPDAFDAITMKHVIEHVEDPIGLVRECHRILKPGGRLSIATPNTECLQHQLFRTAWLELDPPRHLQFHILSIAYCLYPIAYTTILRPKPSRSSRSSTRSQSVRRPPEWWF